MLQKFMEKNNKLWYNIGQIINFVNIFSAFILESCMRMEVKCQGMKYCMNIS